MNKVRKLINKTNKSSQKITTPYFSLNHIFLLNQLMQPITLFFPKNVLLIRIEKVVRILVFRNDMNFSYCLAIGRIGPINKIQVLF